MHVRGLLITVLWIYLQLCGKAHTSFSEVNAARRYLKFHSNTSIHSFASDSNTENIYVGGIDTIYFLSSDLTVKSIFSYNTTCSALSNCSSNSDESLHFIPNFIKLLIVDNSANVLLACGTANHGMCYQHSLNSISNAVLVNSGSFSSDFIVSQTGTTVGIVAPGPAPDNDVFYLARTLDNDLAYNMQQSVASKKWNDDLNGFKLTFNMSDWDLYSYVTVSKSYWTTYKIDYISSFSYNGFTYFVTRQRRTLQQDSVFHIRIVRVCQNDEVFYSYSELILSCKGKNKKRYNLTIDAHMSYVAKDFLVMNGKSGSFNNKAFLFILAGSPSSPSGKEIKYSEGTALCSYAMSSIELAFEDAISECMKNRQYQLGLPFFFDGEKRYCQVAPNQKPAICPNATVTNNNNHVIEVSRPLLGKNVLVTESGLKDNPFSTTFHSAATFVHNQKTVAVIGTVNGSLIFFHIGAYVHFGIPNVTVKVSDEPIVSVKAAKDGMSVYALDKDSVYKVPLSSLCEAVKSCIECLKNEFLQCGYCHSSHKCTLQTGCSQWSNTTCPTSVSNFSPKTGPLQGGSVLTLVGSGLGHTSPRIDHKTIRDVSIGNIAKCIADTFEENYGSLKCQTMPANMTSATFSSVLQIRIYAPFSRSVNGEKYGVDGYIQTMQSFTFVNVSVNHFFPSFGPESGGTLITITGSNLDCGTKIAVEVARFPCNVQNRSFSSVKCKTTSSVRKKRSLHNGTVIIYIDGTSWTLPGNFQYKMDPIFHDRNAIRCIKRYDSQFFHLSFETFFYCHAVLSLKNIKFTFHNLNCLRNVKFNIVLCYNNIDHKILFTMELVMCTMI